MLIVSVFFYIEIFLFSFAKFYKYLWITETSSGQALRSETHPFLKVFFISVCFWNPPSWKLWCSPDQEASHPAGSCSRWGAAILSRSRACVQPWCLSSLCWSGRCQVRDSEQVMGKDLLLILGDHIYLFLVFFI